MVNLLLDMDVFESQPDEVERVRQRMDGLRKHHNESTEIYNRTQPIINNQIHEETLKYLKNGTKTKSQKPRAPKRQRNAQPNNNNNNTSSPVVVQNNPIVTSTTNGIPPQPNRLQQPGHMQQTTTIYQQQQPMHMQHQPQQHFKYQTNHGMYQQQHMQQPTMQHHYQAPQQPQQIYSQTMQPQTTHIVQQHFSQHHNHLNGHPHHPHHQLTPTSLPNDLDLTLQAGLECDIDSLIKHEMSVEGQLYFNHDLLRKLDNQPHQ